MQSNYKIVGYLHIATTQSLKVNIFFTTSKVADQVKECKEFFSDDAFQDLNVDAGLRTKELPSGFTSNLACVDGERFTLDDRSKVKF